MLIRKRVAGLAMLMLSSVAYAGTTGYKDYSVYYVVGFIMICGLIIVAQLLTAFRNRRPKSPQELLEEMEAHSTHTHGHDSVEGKK